MRLPIRIISLALGLAGIGTAVASEQSQIGSTVAVVNQVNAEFEQNRRDLQAGDRVHQDELIEVGEDSKGELLLDDDTMLALGPRSQLLLDKFVYNGERSKGEIVVNLVKGTFRFITGSAAKPSYRIRTPIAAITVRGTVFDVYLGDIGLYLLLLEGGVRVCNEQGTCRILNRPGQILHVGSNGRMGQPSRWASLPDRGAVPFDTAFPFVANAPVVDPDPELTRDEILAVPTPVPPRKPPRKDRTDKPATKTRADRPTYPRKPSREAYVPDGPGLPIGIGIGIGLGKVGKHRRPGHSRPKPNTDDVKYPRFPQRKPSSDRY